MKTIIMSLAALILCGSAYAQAAVKVEPTTQKAGPVVGKLSLEDQYHMRALDSELAVIQQQINEYAKQSHAPEKVQEKNALMVKVCGKIPVDKCSVNTETGEISQRAEPLPSPAPALTNNSKQ